MHKIIFLLLSLLAATAHAQTDFTKKYVDNPDFTVTIIDKEQLQKSDFIEVNGLSIEGAFTKLKEVEYIYTANEKEGKALLKAVEGQYAVAFLIGFNILNPAPPADLLDLPEW